MARQQQIGIGGYLEELELRHGHLIQRKVGGSMSTGV